MSFNLITYNGGQTKPTKPHFYIQNKGLHSGRPMNSPKANCFILLAESDAEKDHLFWLCFALWQAKAFHVEIIGTAIPFIRKCDLSRIISEALTRTEKQDLTKVIQVIEQIDKGEKELLKKIKLFKELKIATLRHKLKV